LDGNFPETRFLDFDQDGIKTRRAISEADKSILRDYCKAFYRSGLMPKALGMDKATPDSLMGKYMQKEIGLKHICVCAKRFL
jgi:hypothetical protein